MNKATIVHPGFYCSIQDLGRLDYRNVGVPQSGAMDMQLAKKTNTILGNSEEAAVLEMILMGVTISFETKTYVSISQNVDGATLNGKTISMDKAIAVEPGDVLKIGHVTHGNFAYVGISGGWKTKPILASRSMFAGITASGKLSKGDTVPYENCFEVVEETRFRESELNQNTLIDVFEGPEFHLLSATHQDQLLSQTLEVSKSWSRMAFKVSTGTPFDLPELRTVPVMPGTVQLTPDGDLLFLMRDAQTTGGYPRVLQLSNDAIDKFSQLRTGVSFNLSLRPINHS
ncbi:5-oxoprolinase subunit C family protein [Nonlabens agnitus]|uniref:Carboxyltransferase domain-containing protein n=1 Tax=Nonlabens agnitus TaxID=870484 RepID=A0A2S9WRT5_9FLAO|nr:biotin-dependent carboxyltransferase family protein [Nonlabens agnitus]PRP66207.1 hypothetical protein BST86_03420 [Nonlabens agnitus]